MTGTTHGKSHPPHEESVSDGGSVPFTDRNNAHISSANSRTLPPSAVEQTHIGSCATSRALKSRHHPELIGVTLSNTPSGKAHMTTLGHHSLHQRCEYSFVPEAMYQGTSMFQMYPRLPAGCTCDRAYLKTLILYGPWSALRMSIFPHSLEKLQSVHHQLHSSG